jgi:protoporphyrin/coproporphyrin ferrochelatase
VPSAAAPVSHVVIVTYGEPTTPAFLDQLVYSWRILLGLTRTVAPMPRPLVPMIALARAHGRRKTWRASGYASPLEPITTARRGGGPWRVHVAYEFRAPLLADVLAALPEGESVWVAPMYAADSAFTHALSRTTAAQTLAGRAVRVLDPLACDVLADLSAAHVLDLTGSAAPWRGDEVALVLAAHGTVLNPPTPIDTGLAATEALRVAITERLSPHFGLVTNGWLNHTRGGQWTDPPIEASLRHVANRGFTRVVYYPYGFLADNAESELEGQMALATQPSLAAKHLPCLNDSRPLARALAQQVLALA